MVLGCDVKYWVMDPSLNLLDPSACWRKVGLGIQEYPDDISYSIALTRSQDIPGK